MGDAVPASFFKKWDTAPGLQLKSYTSLHYINVDHSNYGLENQGRLQGSLKSLHGPRRVPLSGDCYIQ